jgi:hypothetical protein
MRKAWGGCGKASNYSLGWVCTKPKATPGNPSFMQLHTIDTLKGRLQVLNSCCPAGMQANSCRRRHIERLFAAWLGNAYV